MMQQPEQSEANPQRCFLPWAIAAATLLLYLLTLNHWVTFASLPVVAKVAGWDWNTTIQSPLLHLVTYPFRWLPAGVQPVALNVFAAACAALTLAALARSVSLLPHDRTREQRQRERGAFGLLSIRAAWVPPILAALVCGLQLTFWEHATAITGEMLNLLLFAEIIRRLLEYRLHQEESHLTWLAFLFGLAMPNNWAMIGFFPLLVIALVWIRGASCFQFNFLARMFLVGAAGLLLYLLIPFVEWKSGNSSVSFWQMVRAELSGQKAFVFFGPLRNRALVCGLASVLPLLFIGFRWPSTFGDMSAVGAAITNLLLKLIHGIFLVATLWVAFDPPFSPRELGFGLPFLTFYYLGALCVGYFSGYFLLVLGTDPEKSWRRTSGLPRVIGRGFAGLIWIALLAVPGGLIYRNLPDVRSLNGPSLRDFAQLTAQALPAKGAVVISDDATQLLLLEGALSSGAARPPHILLDSDLLQYHLYQKHLAKRYAGQWPAVPWEQWKNPIDSGHLLQLVGTLYQTNEVYYLQPSFGYYFENFYLEPRGPVYKLTQFTDQSVMPPPLTAADIANNQAAWAKLDLAHGSDLLRLVQHKLGGGQLLGQYLARALSYWGVCLQRNQQPEPAARWFAAAQQLNPDNVAAVVNQKFNENLRRGKFDTVSIEKAAEEKLGQYPNWISFLRACGPVDEPGFCYNLGQVFARQSLFRQAAQQFVRVQALRPEHTDARLWLGNVYLRAQLPVQVLEVVHQLQAEQPTRPLSADNVLELVRLEAWAYFYQTNFPGAERLLLATRARFPQSDFALINISQMHLQMGDVTNALARIEEQLRLTPDNSKALLNKSAIFIHLKNYDQAIAPLDRVLTLDPKNTPALVNRALAFLRAGKLDAAQKDYETLRALQPDLNSVSYQLGEIAWQRKDFTAARAHFQRFLKTADPDDEEAKAAQQRLEELKTGRAKG